MIYDDMTSKVAKALVASTMFALIATLMVSSTPAYAINGHGVSYGPSFGGELVKYTNGLKINGMPFDISEFTQTIPTQTLYVNNPSDITLKIYDKAGPQSIKDVTIYMNLQGNDPSVTKSDTKIEWNKVNGVSSTDPGKIFKSVTAKLTVDKTNTFAWIHFKIVPQGTMKTTDLIVRAYDTNLATGQAIILNAINIGYPPAGGFSDNTAS